MNHTINPLPTVDIMYPDTGLSFIPLNDLLGLSIVVLGTLSLITALIGLSLIPRDDKYDL